MRIGQVSARIWLIWPWKPQELWRTIPRPGEEHLLDWNSGSWSHSSTHRWQESHPRVLWKPFGVFATVAYTFVIFTLLGCRTTLIKQRDVEQPKSIKTRFHFGQTFCMLVVPGTQGQGNKHLRFDLAEPATVGMPWSVMEIAQGYHMDVLGHAQRLWYQGTSPCQLRLEGRNARNQLCRSRGLEALSKLKPLGRLRVEPLVSAIRDPERLSGAPETSSEVGWQGLPPLLVFNGMGKEGWPFRGP